MQRQLDQQTILGILDQIEAEAWFQEDDLTASLQTRDALEQLNELYKDDRLRTFADRKAKERDWLNTGTGMAERLRDKLATSGYLTSDQAIMGNGNPGINIYPGFLPSYDDNMKGLNGDCGETMVICIGGKDKPDSGIEAGIVQMSKDLCRGATKNIIFWAAAWNSARWREMVGYFRKTEPVLQIVFGMRGTLKVD